MKDPQKWANTFFSQLLHILRTNAKGGLMVEQGAIDNPRKFEKDWAKADSIAMLKPGGLNKVAPKTPPIIPPAISELMNFSISSIRDTSGVSLELLGMADREQAGYLEAQRTKAGLTILAGFFDALRLYRKRQGRILAYFIQEYLSDGRLVKIVGLPTANSADQTRQSSRNSRSFTSGFPIPVSRVRKLHFVTMPMPPYDEACGRNIPMTRR